MEDIRVYVNCKNFDDVCYYGMINSGCPLGCDECECWELREE